MINPDRKTIIFDFGNILINLDHKKCYETFLEVLEHDFSAGMPEKLLATFHRYEKGEINTESFLWVLQQFKPDAEIRDIIYAWNSILGELPQSRFDMLLELRSKYNIAMLSNINDMHEIEIDKRVKQDMGIEDFHATYFDKVFYSHLIGYKKPDSECYAFVQKQLGVKAEDILFIDDMEKNIVAAKAMGWNGQVHNPNHDIINNIANYLLHVGF